MSTRQRTATKDQASLRALDAARDQVQSALTSARAVKVAPGSRNTMDAALRCLVDAQRLLDSVKSDAPDNDSLSSLHTTALPSGV